MLVFQVQIPTTPPGINQTYKVSQKWGFDKKGKKVKKAFMYKDASALEWAKGAALIIGAEAGVQNFQFNIKSKYKVEFDFAAKGYDVDAPLKLILDTLCQKLGFNDKYISETTIRKSSKVQEGIIIKLYEEKNERIS